MAIPYLNIARALAVKTGQLADAETAALFETVYTSALATATSVTVGTLYLTDGTVKQVEVGAADSGGTGYKLLRVLN